MAESAVVKAIDRALTARGAWHFNLHGAGVGRNGLPDIVAIYRGRPILIETKSLTGRVMPLQTWELGLARRAGAITIIARQLADVTDVLDDIDAADIGGAA
jgi:Holliday junction resolvase